VAVKSRGCCGFGKSQEEEDDELMEHIVINLDTCGKISLITAFAALNLGTLAAFCIQYYSYSLNECNPAFYRLPQPFKENGAEIDYGVALGFGLFFAVVLKFAAIVNMAMALEEYENLSENWHYFLYSIACTAAPSSLLGPLFTYDHENCLASNFVLTNSEAAHMSASAISIWFFVIIFYLCIPATCASWSCLKQAHQKQVKP